MKNLINFRLIGSALLIFIMIILVAACSNETNQEDNNSAAEEEQTSVVDEYPEEPILVQVAWTAGGGTDVNARTLAKHASEVGLDLVIENTPGSGGRLGFSKLASAEPNGYNIGVLNLPTGIMYTIDGSVQYEADSFEPIIGQVIEPRVLLVPEDSPFETITEFLNYATENPEELVVAVGGPDSHTYFTMIETQNYTDTEYSLVAMQGTGESMVALAAGDIDAAVGGPSEAETVDGVRALAVYTDERVEHLPDVPTMKETGYDLEMAALRTYVAPKGTDPEQIKILHDKFKEVFKLEEYKKDMEEQGVIQHYLSSEDLQEEIDSVIQVFTPLIEEEK